MNICPVCGFSGLNEPAHDRHGYASFEICPCCGVEFGYHDAGRSHESLREEWIAKGTPWWGDGGPPPGWDPVEQLRSLTHGAAGPAKLDDGRDAADAPHSTLETTCPVCGYGGLDEPPFDDVGAPSYEICPCCGTEFGHDDAETPHAVLRERWVARGTPWHSRVRPAPRDWNAAEQLRRFEASEAARAASRSRRR